MCDWYNKWNSIYLKSVDGSLPCQPISFHCSDIKPRSSSSGKAAFHKALKASYKRITQIIRRAFTIPRLLECTGVPCKFDEFFSECTEMHIHQTNKHKEIAYI